MDPQGDSRVDPVTDPNIDLREEGGGGGGGGGFDLSLCDFFFYPK